MGDAAYFGEREREERALAAQATNPKARKIHAMLADKYAQLAEKERQREQHDTSF